MTDQRELDRLLGAFFVEGTDELADRVIDAALDHIDHTPQRRAMNAPWRFQTMPMLTRVAAAAVIGVLAVGGALFLLRPGTPTVGGPSATPGASSSPTVAATSTPSTTPPSPTPLPTGTSPADCVNPPPDIAALIAQTDPVACYGNAPLTLVASPIAAQIDCPVIVEPVWLACGTSILRPVGGSKFGPELVVNVDPKSGISFSDYLNKNVRITGHFDDPAARTCREAGRSPAVEGTPEPAAATIESCRRKFVVTQVVTLKP